MLFYLLMIGMLPMTVPPKSNAAPPVRRTPLPGLLPGLPQSTTCLDADIVVGQILDPATRKALTARHGHKLRILYPGAIVTMDMIPDRINLRLDRQDRILGISCG